MRNKFAQEQSPGVVSISSVKINRKTRHQLAPILIALQYLLTDAEMSKKVFKIIEDRVQKGKKKTGRPGMSLWEILVLSTVRLSLDIDYDFLLDQANDHSTLRGILGVRRSDSVEEKEYKYQTVVDNVSLLDEETIKKISDLVVESGHRLLKKKGTPSELI